MIAAGLQGTTDTYDIDVSVHSPTAPNCCTVTNATDLVKSGCPVNSNTGFKPGLRVTPNSGSFHDRTLGATTVSSGSQ